MNWDNLPDDILKMIFSYRREITCGDKAAKYIQRGWNKYRTKILIGRYKMLWYLKEFREWNPTLNEFLIRSKL